MLPMIIERSGFGLSEGCVAPVLNHVAGAIDPNLTGALNAIFLAAFNIGVTAGGYITSTVVNFQR